MLERPLFIGSEIYRHSSYGAWHPLRVPRVSTVMDLSRALGWLPDEAFVRSPRARPNALEHWHRPDYIAALQRAEESQSVTDEERARFNIGTVSNPVFPEMFRRPATAAGGSILAGELLRHGGIVFHPAGGTHHGMPGYANGSCFVNDPVLAILSLRAHGAQRIAYVDIDAHHPDGVQHAFAGDADCLLISVHEDGLWPRTGGLMDDGGGNVFNLPVPRGFNDTEMEHVREALILPLVSRFAPDAIVLQCGADALHDDPQSHLSLSNRAHLGVVAGLMTLSLRFLVLGGGGYNPWTAGRLWTAVWGVLNGFDLPDRVGFAAASVLRGLRFEGHRIGRFRRELWCESLLDAGLGGFCRREVLCGLGVLLDRAREIRE